MLYRSRFRAEQVQPSDDGPVWITLTGRRFTHWLDARAFPDGWLEPRSGRAGHPRPSPPALPFAGPLPLPDACSERNLIFREVADQIRGGPWMIGRGRIMPTSPVSSLIEHICRAVPPLGDAELLGRFVERRDETALTALVKRHRPTGWGVCPRLPRHHDPDDAFQATFIVLVRKAASVEPRAMVGNWIYG